MASQAHTHWPMAAGATQASTRGRPRPRWEWCTAAHARPTARRARRTSDGPLPTRHPASPGGRRAVTTTRARHATPTAREAAQTGAGTGATAAMAQIRAPQAAVATTCSATIAPADVGGRHVGAPPRQGAPGQGHLHHVAGPRHADAVHQRAPPAAARPGPRAASARARRAGRRRAPARSGPWRRSRPRSAGRPRRAGRASRGRGSRRRRPQSIRTAAIATSAASTAHRAPDRTARALTRWRGRGRPDTSGPDPRSAGGPVAPLSPEVTASSPGRNAPAAQFPVPSGSGIRQCTWSSWLGQVITMPGGPWTSRLGPTKTYWAPTATSLSTSCWVSSRS